MIGRVQKGIARDGTAQSAARGRSSARSHGRGAARKKGCASKGEKKRIHFKFRHGVTREKQKFSDSKRTAIRCAACAADEPRTFS